VTTPHIAVVREDQRVTVVRPAPERVTVLRPSPDVVTRVSGLGLRGPQGATGPRGTSRPRTYGDGPPGVIIGAQPGDEYVDQLTGDLYVLD
jgi:hypothetical protein